MYVRKFAECSLAALLLFAPQIDASKKAAPLRSTTQEKGSEADILWRDPGDISARNLFYGPGGKAHEPRPPFVFLKEDLDGTNPKFSIRDKNGTKWKVKMGGEVRAETAASRIVWAVGYFTNEDYYLPVATFEKMPDKLHRGQSYVEKDGSVRDLRFKREDQKKLDIWEWRDAPFAGTREWNGLRVIMALINNWDLKDVNNAVYEKGAQRVYEVSDLGATFGSASRTWPKDKSKGDLSSYQKSKFIVHESPDTVSFRAPGRPSLIYFVNPKEYFQRVRMEWIGRHIPREDARWIGELLARLSPAQIRDAFRAAGFAPSDIEGFSAVLETRIRVLTDL